MPATFKLVLAAKADSDGLFDVRLRITADRVVRYQNTGVALPEKQWNPNATLLTKNWVRTAHRQHDALNKNLVRWHDRAQQLAQDNPIWDADQLKAALRNGDIDPTAPDFIAFCYKQLDEQQQLLDEAHTKGRPTIGLSQASIDMRRYCVNKLAAWHGKNKPLPLPLLTTELLKKYERYLLHKLDNAPSTTTRDLKTLHIFVSEAVKAKQLKRSDDPVLFYDYPTGKKKRVWLEQAEVIDFETVPLPTPQHLARSVYFLQHYLHGSRVGVVLRLRWQDRTGGRLRFTMDKGGHEKDVAETPELTALLDSLLPAGGQPPKPTDFILPYFPANFDQLHPRDQLRLSKNAITTVNRHLKKYGAQLDTAKNLTSHVARRTLATLGERALAGDLRATGSLLGHRRVSTTEIYLNERDTSEVDAAATTVYDALRAGKTQVKQNSDASPLSVSDSSEKAA